MPHTLLGTFLKKSEEQERAIRHLQTLPILCSMVGHCGYDN